jgi:hypothetical protein
MVTRWALRLRTVALMAASSLMLVPPLAAQSVDVQASVTPQPIGVNSQFVLKVEVSGTQQLDTAPEPPALDFAEYLGASTNTSMRMINGRTTVSIAVQFRYRATRQGTFTIPTIQVMTGGTRIRSRPLQVTVGQASANTTATRPDGSVVEIPRDALFVTGVPSKRRVYVNEPVIVDYRIYTQVQVEGYNVTAAPSTSGFWVEELETPSPPQVENVTRDGKQYASAVIFRRALFPTGAGTRTVAPLSIEAQVRLDRRSRDAFDLFARGLFAERVPVVVSTDSIGLEVVPLPAAGRPSEFTGFVGDLEVDVSIDKTEAATNEALTYTLRVAGMGNLQTLPEPSIAFPDAFEVYPPETSQNIERSGNQIRGSKQYEYVLIPRVSGTHTIPEVRYGYFNPATEQYAVASAAPIRTVVTGDSDEGPAIAAGGRGAVTTLRRDIRFIRVAMPKFERRNDSLFRSAGFWLVALVPLSVLGVAAGVRRHQDRLAGDVAFARGRRASKVARRRLGQARSLLRPANAKAFHAEVARALRGFLGDKLNVPEASVAEESARAQLERRGVPLEMIDEYFACIQLCDRYRFAPADVTIDHMHALLDRASRAMTDVERWLR